MKISFQTVSAYDGVKNYEVKDRLGTSTVLVGILLEEQEKPFTVVIVAQKELIIAKRELGISTNLNNEPFIKLTDKVANLLHTMEGEIDNTLLEVTNG